MATEGGLRVNADPKAERGGRRRGGEATAGAQASDSPNVLRYCNHAPLVGGHSMARAVANWLTSWAAVAVYAVAAVTLWTAYMCWPSVGDLAAEIVREVMRGD